MCFYVLHRIDDGDEQRYAGLVNAAMFYGHERGERRNTETKQNKSRRHVDLGCWRRLNRYGFRVWALKQHLFWGEAVRDRK